jgi:hypothetical protein
VEGNDVTDGMSKTGVSQTGFLFLLADGLNDSTELPITLVVHGQTITGKVIAATRWFSDQIRRWPTTTTPRPTRRPGVSSTDGFRSEAMRVIE